MTDYVIWTRGLRGPEISILYGHNNLGEYERNRVISDPKPISEQHAGLSLLELADRYPVASHKGETS